MCENELDEETSKKEKKRNERERKTVVRSKHDFTCQTQIEYNKMKEMEGKISNVPLKHEAGLCLIVILKNNTLSSLKVFFVTSVTWEDQLNVGDVILPLQAILEFIVHTD